MLPPTDEELCCCEIIFCGICGCCYLLRCFIDDNTETNEICVCRKCREGRCIYFLPCFEDDGSINHILADCKFCCTPLDKNKNTESPKPENDMSRD